MTALEALNKLEHAFLEGDLSTPAGIREMKAAYFAVKEHITAVRGQEARDELMAALKLCCEDEDDGFQRGIARIRAGLVQN